MILADPLHVSRSHIHRTQRTLLHRTAPRDHHDISLALAGAVFGGGAEAAVDGDANTFWDAESAGLTSNAYVSNAYVLELQNTGAFGGYSMTGDSSNTFSAQSWDLLCNGTSIDSQENYVYSSNRFTQCLPSTYSCEKLELSITEWFGTSPIVRELELFNIDGAPHLHTLSAPRPDGIAPSRLQTCRWPLAHRHAPTRNYCSTARLSCRVSGCQCMQLRPRSNSGRKLYVPNS